MSWTKTLAVVAPALAKAVGGPLAGVAVKMIGRALGLGEDADEDKIKTAIEKADPETLLKLRQVDHTFQAEMKRLEIDASMYATEVDDRKDARQLGVSRGLLPQILLATIFVVGFIYVLRVIFAGASIPADMREIATYVLGILSSGLVQIMNYFFGSSAGSKEKTQLLKASA